MITREEQEVIIRWDRTDGPATICSAIPAIWRRLEKAGYVAVASDVSSGDVAVCKTFEIPRGQISVSVMNPLRPRKSGQPGFKVRSAVKSTFGGKR